MASGLSSIISSAFPAPSAAAYQPEQPMQAQFVGNPIQYFLASMLNQERQQEMGQAREAYTQDLQQVGQQRRDYAQTLLAEDRQAEQKKAMLGVLKGMAGKLPMAGVLQNMGYDGNIGDLQEADTLNRRLLESQIAKNNRGPMAKPPQLQIATPAAPGLPLQFTMRGSNIGEQDIQRLQELQTQYGGGGGMLPGGGAAMRQAGEQARQGSKAPIPMSNKGVGTFEGEAIEGTLTEGVDPQGNPAKILIAPDGGRYIVE